jgi:hypothetical protein
LVKHQTNANSWNHKKQEGHLLKTGESRVGCQQVQKDGMQGTKA